MTANGFNLLNRQSTVLACFALSIGLVLWLFDLATGPQIELNKQTQLKLTLSELLADRWFNNDLPATKKVLFDADLNVERTVYTATLDNQPSAAIISARAADGYAGDIDLLVSILVDGSITGVRVVQHQETPGLGDDIEIRKSDWMLNFNSTSLTAPTQWAVKRDGGSFDQFTGATITPRAVVRAVNQTLVFFNQYQGDIFSQSND